jgi:hypothetical protein
MSELIDPRQQGPDEAGFTEIVRLIGASGATARWTNWPATLPDGNLVSADSRAVTLSE